jgi:hypothetical protein
MNLILWIWNLHHLNTYKLSNILLPIVNKYKRDVLIEVKKQELEKLINEIK